jgi:hypothetical protein
MTPEQWEETARKFAAHMRQFRTLVERGVAPIRFLEESTMGDVANCPVVVGVFGNDHQHTTEAQREIDLVRERLKGLDAVELAFGTSEDDETWAMLVGAASNPYMTSAGQTLQRELFKATLEDALWNAWREIQYAQLQLAIQSALA